MIERIIPTKNRILAKREEPEVMHNGIIIPDQSRDRNQIAVVVRVGKNVTEIMPGDRILIKKFYGEGISFSEDHCLILEEDVIGYIRE